MAEIVLENFTIVNGWHKFLSTKLQRRHLVFWMFICVYVKKGFLLSLALLPIELLLQSMSISVLGALKQIITKPFTISLFPVKGGEIVVASSPEILWKYRIKERSSGKEHEETHNAHFLSYTVIKHTEG